MFKITGLDEFQRELEQMRRNAEQLAGEHQVPLTDLFPPAFMRQHSGVPDFESFCRDGGIDLSSNEAFAALPGKQLDAVVKRLTQFASWEEMKQAGAADWANRRLVDGIGG